MVSFIQQQSSKIIGTLTGFDRVRLRGTLRWLSNVRGMLGYLSAVSVLLKEFTGYAKDFTEQIRQRTEQEAKQAGRPLIYLTSGQQSKEELAREIARRDKIQEGLICVFTCVEPCYSYSVGPNRAKKQLELRYGSSKCLHQYHYLQDPQLGFMHVRLQTWFPFTLHVCLNGREWLARQMDMAGLGYTQRDNCFTALQDVTATQALFDSQLCVSWASLMNRLTRQVHPLHRTLFADPPNPYYWSVAESEWATDVMFRSQAELADLYTRLLRHGIAALGSADVMRFLGHRTPAHGAVNAKFQGEVVSDLKARPEGVRIKHRAGVNSIKMYDKQGTVLRVETTLNAAGPLKVYRATEKGVAKARKTGRPAVKKWRPLRKGVADLARRAKLCDAANKRYLEALAKVDDATPLGQLSANLCQPTLFNGRRVRALNPFGAEDGKLLAAVCRGEFALQGFRNQDLRPLLFTAAATTPTEARRQSSAVHRRLRLLRAHGLIHKIPKTHRYQLTDQGRTTLVALLHAQQASTQQLLALAA
jgi:DNA-binding PadR family transcriptional regulator